MTLYKLTDAAGHSIHGDNLLYKLPTQNDDGTWTPGAWTRNIEHVVPCKSGYHVIDADHVQRWLTLGCVAWEVETKGHTLLHDAGDNAEKHVSQAIRLMRPAPEVIPAWWRDVEVFIPTIANVPWFQPQGDPAPAWKVFDTRDAARDAAGAAAWDAAWDTAGAAAWNAAWAAARAAGRDAARDTARDTARATAWDAARDAGRDAGWDAGWDAELMTAILLCADFPVDPAHIAHARSRWDVWLRGYGLLCDVDGALFVYCKP